ncbi:MAG TPA: hypothetical protein VKC62_06955, partial [Gaiellaceae bacterium]|nr:hypothetical protein [Gaiellaceae bacterium]
NQAHLDPRVKTVPGTPVEPEALISIPLVARSQIKGVFNLYRSGTDVGDVCLRVLERERH